ncbi:MAG: hypothetical protein U0841_26175 [Chloroflexia bacterium]
MVERQASFSTPAAWVFVCSVGGFFAEFQGQGAVLGEGDGLGRGRGVQLLVGGLQVAEGGGREDGERDGGDSGRAG